MMIRRALEWGAVAVMAVAVGAGCQRRREEGYQQPPAAPTQAPQPTTAQPNPMGERSPGAMPGTPGEPAPGATGTTPGTGTAPATGTTPGTTTGTTTTEQPANAEQTLGALHAFATTEVEAGKLAQKRARGADVKEFGKSLVQTYQDVDQRVAEYAGKHNIKLTTATAGTQGGESAGVPTGTTPEATGAQGAQQGMMTAQEALKQLRTLRGAEFDKQFTAVQAQQNQRALETVRAARTLAQGSDMGDVLAGIEDKIRITFDKATELAQKHGGAQGALTPEPSDEPMGQGRRPPPAGR
jgi:predicted outer membrane protein